MTNPVNAMPPKDLLSTCEKSLNDCNTYLDAALSVVKTNVMVDGRVDAGLLEQEQHIAHGAAWISTYVSALSQLLQLGHTLVSNGKFSEFDRLTLQIGFAEYLAQLQGGIAMSQTEFVRPQSFGLDPASFFKSAETQSLLNGANRTAAQQNLVSLMDHYQGHSCFGDDGLDEDYTLIRDQFRRFSDEQVIPFAHDWHLENALIPTEIIQDVAELGVFGLTIPEEYGGSGMGKLAMCVVTEELARGYIGVGSLGTRAEIAGELILCGGTSEQKQHWLPKIASGECLPTAVFTEPNTGSDLGSLKTRAVKQGDEFVITGNKTWITHAARANLMTMLVRTDPETTNHKGLSIFLAEKPSATDADDFPATGMQGSEIEVLGYRGMREYELSFDGFTLPEDALLGGVENKGFGQLMQTFEGARIQTAARAIGVAQSALELGLAYANERVQFGKPLANFPRVYNKLALMAVEITIARQLAYHSAKEKDNGKRCDLEAGMAKLLGARVAWSCADNALQIHGGNGFALEFPISRILCDARILSIFEGAAEIQANVIIRRLLDTV